MRNKVFGGLVIARVAVPMTATHEASVQEPPDTAVLMAAKELHWMPLTPDSGLQWVPLWGDRSQPDEDGYGMLLMVPAGMDHHHAITIQGTWLYTAAGDAAPKELPPGSLRAPAGRAAAQRTLQGPGRLRALHPPARHCRHDQAPHETLTASLAARGSPASHRNRRGRRRAVGHARLRSPHATSATAPSTPNQNAHVRRQKMLTFILAPRTSSAPATPTLCQPSFLVTPITVTPPLPASSWLGSSRTCLTKPLVRPSEYT